MARPCRPPFHDALPGEGQLSRPNLLLIGAAPMPCCQDQTPSTAGAGAGLRMWPGVVVSEVEGGSINVRRSEVDTRRAIGGKIRETCWSFHRWPLSASTTQGGKASVMEKVIMGASWGWELH